MIYDLGCQNSGGRIVHLLTSLPGALACLLLAAVLAVLGSALTRTKNFSAIDPLMGWSVVALVMTLAAICSPQALPMTTVYIGLIMAAALLVAFRKKYFTLPILIVSLFPGLVILTAINAVGIGKWDDFSHWVPNALFVYAHDGVPSEALPSLHSAWPGYPYAVPFLTYLASHLAGGFLIQGGAMMNFLWLFIFAAALTELYPASPNQQTSRLKQAGFLAFALLTVTLLNPNFNASFTMTSQGDTATMVVIGMLGLQYWKLLEALKGQDKDNIKQLTLQIIGLGILIVLIKQSDFAVLGIVTFAFLIVGILNRQAKPAFAISALTLMVAFVVRCLWQHYVDRHISGNGFTLHPFAEWRLDLLGPMFKGMAKEAFKKSGCFGLMLGIIMYAVYSLFQPRTALRNFAILAGATSLGYFLFLGFCYIAATFNENEIRRAASFYRYSTHVGLLNTAFLWIAAPHIWNWVKSKISIPTFLPRLQKPATCIAFALLPLVLLIHPEAVVATPSEGICAFREEARNVISKIPENAHLAIYEPEGDGMFSFVTGFEMALNETQHPDHQLNVSYDITQFNLDTRDERIKELTTAQDVDAVYLLQAKKDAQQILGHSNQSAPVLLVRHATGWEAITP